MDSTSARHPIFNRDFRYLWVGNTISGCGDQFFLVALPWLIPQNSPDPAPSLAESAFLANSEFGSPTAFGLLMSSVAAGSLIGLLLAAARKQRKRGTTSTRRQCDRWNLYGLDRNA
jgi:hypothetical protein